MSTEKTLTAPVDAVVRRRICPTCNGNGRVEMLEHCPTCDGCGEVVPAKSLVTLQNRIAASLRRTTKLTVGEKEMVDMTPGSSVTFAGVTSGDCECFCWDDVPGDVCDQIRQAPEWIKADPELRELNGRLYPNDVFRFLGLDQGRRCKFTITVELTD